MSVPLQWRGITRSGADAIDIVDRDGRLLLSPFAGMTVEIRSVGDSLVIDDRLVSGPRLESWRTIGSDWAARAIEKKPAVKPAPESRTDGTA